MSQAYNRVKKQKRRATDAENPERRRIRRLIRSGAFPRFFMMKSEGIKGQIIWNGKYVDKKTGRRVVIKGAPTLKSVFNFLTLAEKAK